MAKTILVVIPTSGSHLDLARIREVVTDTAKGARTNGLNPLFVIVPTRATKQKIQEVLTDTSKRVEHLLPKDERFGASILEGIEHGLAKHRPHFVMAMYGDYAQEAKHSGEFIQQAIAPGASEVMTGAWKKPRTTALELPHPQVLNELGVSSAVTYANPHFHPDDLRPGAALAKARKEGMALQTYSGLFFIRSTAWRAIRTQLQTTLKGAEEHYKGWAVEPAIVLAALNTGIRVKNAFFERGYEHPFPKPNEQQRFIEGRLQQYDAGISVVKHFLTARGEHEKAAHLIQAAKNWRRRIETSSLRRKYHQKLKEKFDVHTFLYPRDD